MGLPPTPQHPTLLLLLADFHAPLSATDTDAGDRALRLAPPLAVVTSKQPKTMVVPIGRGNANCRNPEFPHGLSTTTKGRLALRREAL